MKRFSTLLLYVTIAFLLLWQLPWCYNFFVVKPEKTPFTLYSFVIGDFALMGQEEERNRTSRRCRKHLFRSSFRQYSAYVLFPPVDVRRTFSGYD